MESAGEKRDVMEAMGEAVDPEPEAVGTGAASSSNADVSEERKKLEAGLVDALSEGDWRRVSELAHELLGHGSESKEVKRKKDVEKGSDDDTDKEGLRKRSKRRKKCVASSASEEEGSASEAAESDADDSDPFRGISLKPKRSRARRMRRKSSTRARSSRDLSDSEEESESSNKLFDDEAIECEVILRKRERLASGRVAFDPPKKLETNWADAECSSCKAGELSKPGHSDMRCPVKNFEEQLTFEALQERTSKKPDQYGAHACD
ncbi:unnamed protein product [Vitrella brassicaformis CCMP3155]|uniref:Uncharacterized protein n=2 Tax=Vitrella brassicaformis TaxID=1169539 RepID=A0A0G4EE02_VITBC|nr:unnamed protein product [Vitrella brassicaformis CCMP3155]|mmetsp:Transcript_51853/g.130248  ORF Transcript_51853/g.130248 Transcript_51853/m.130248 type:complete len:264 (+) Transcript_51853:133-924(+)|eukprot:CEL93979.1 unnamed protein product [Vitrella brassicaformis CCMP3155]